MGLQAFVIRRMLLLIPTILGVVLLTFAITQVFSPEQRATLYIRDASKYQNLENLVELYHLNDPAYIQFFNWLKELLNGNLGYSHTAKMSVVEAITTKFPATAEIVLFSIPLTVFLGIYLGIQSAVHRDTWVDHVTRGVAIAGWSLPSFWLGIMLLSIFFATFHLFPPGRLSTDASLMVASQSFIRYTGLNTIDGILNGQLWVTFDALVHIVLPTITLTIIQIALIVRVMRSSMLEALGKNYIVMARAKGLSKKEVINKHARKNALIPVVTLSGLLAAGMLNGVVITETIFNIPGVGRFGASAALNIDVPAILGFAFFSGFLFVIANFAVDILYAYIDPKIRLE